MKNRIRRLPLRLLETGRISAERNSRAYLVGGAVRDFLLGKKNLDWDIVVEGNTKIVVRKLAGLWSARIVEHARFGTYVLELPDGNHVDFATARRETYAKPGALPIVRPGTLRDDLSRRDFTLNAIACSLQPSDTGTILDYYGGRADLRKKTLRVLHPLSFLDDPTRILRLARFAARGFKIERKTRHQVSRYKSYILKVSAERRREELLAILSEPTAYRALSLMDRWGILKSFLPGISLRTGLQTIRRRSSPAEKLRSLLEGIPAAKRKKLVESFKFSRQFKRELLELEKPARASNPVNGDDLIRLGYRPGPIFRTILDNVSGKGFQSRKRALGYIIDNFPLKR